VSDNKEDRDRIYHRLIDYIKSRKNIEFNLKDILRSVISDMFGWMICTCRKNVKKYKIRRTDLLNKGREKVIEELDCVAMIRRMRMIDNMA